MRLRSERARARFRWALFRGRCRRNLLAGLVLLALAAAYGAWAGMRFGRWGADTHGAIDQPLVSAALGLARQPSHLATIVPRNDRELYLASVVSDQHDTVFGVVLLVLRILLVGTVGGLGLVLLTAGATEWEIRSEYEPPDTLARDA